MTPPPFAFPPLTELSLPQPRPPPKLCALAPMIKSPSRYTGRQSCIISVPNPSSNIFIHLGRDGLRMLTSLYAGQCNRICALAKTRDAQDHERAHRCSNATRQPKCLPHPPSHTSTTHLTTAKSQTAHFFRGGVNGREPPPNPNLDFSAGFRMRKEHMRLSSMAITAPACTSGVS